MLYFITSLTHILYFFIWDYTDKYIKFSYYLRTSPIFLMTLLSSLQKLIQISLIINYSIQNNTLIPYVSNFNIYNFILITIGQILNISVYYKIGIIGVYYGNKLGYNLPWITTFPYNIGINNPQYIGCILTLFGLYPLLSIEYIIYASSLYQITSFIESK